MFGRQKESPRAILPAGTYVVGDPCYAISDESWIPWLEAAGMYEYHARGVDLDLFVAPIITDGPEVAAVSTVYGDGVYYDQRGRAYGVDAGLIGAVPLEAAVKDTWAMTDAHLVEFTEPFAVYRDSEGVIHIGALLIPTGYED